MYTLGCQRNFEFQFFSQTIIYINQNQKRQGTSLISQKIHYENQLVIVIVRVTMFFFSDVKQLKWVNNGTLIVTFYDTYTK